MAKNYNIDYSDPLSGSFTIPDAGFNGPGGKVSTTTLRLYGRGAPEWGESVDENFVKLLENFMGATTPHYPVPGQLWIKTYLYFYNSDDDLWFNWDVASEQWVSISVISATSAPLAPATGQYWYNPDDQVLSQYFQLYKQETAQWHERVYRQDGFDPTGLYTAEHQAQMFDVSTQNWVQLPIVEKSSSTDSPVDGRAGTLRFDPSNGTMLYWNTFTTSWTAFAIGGSNPAIFGDLNMGNYAISNLAAPSSSDQALNLGFADARFIKKSGDSATGHITQGAGNPTQPLHLATKAYVDATSAAAAAAAIATLVTVPSGIIVMWSGALTAVPSGWFLCDGTNGTPNLRDRFVIGAGLSYPVGTTGGSKDAVVVAHDHVIGGTASMAGDHIHPIGDPGHAHNVSSNTIRISVHDIVSGVVWGGEGASGNKGYAEPAGTGISLGYAGAHTHPLTGSVGSSGQSATDANLPPYYALAYIMKA